MKQINAIIIVLLYTSSSLCEYKQKYVSIFNVDKGEICTVFTCEGVYLKKKVLILELTKYDWICLVSFTSERAAFLKISTTKIISFINDIMFQNGGLVNTF